MCFKCDCDHNVCVARCLMPSHVKRGHLVTIAIHLAARQVLLNPVVRAVTHPDTEEALHQFNDEDVQLAILLYKDPEIRRVVASYLLQTLFPPPSSWIEKARQECLKKFLLMKRCLTQSLNRFNRMFLEACYC